MTVFAVTTPGTTAAKVMTKRIAGSSNMPMETKKMLVNNSLNASHFPTRECGNRTRQQQPPEKRPEQAQSARMCPARQNTTPQKEQNNPTRIAAMRGSTKG
jgi:hypothetical protein